MKYFLQLLTSVWVLVCVFSIEVFAEIRIDFPANRAVFQRDKNNTATIYISGMYTKVIDRVEARLVTVDGYQGSSTDWKTIQSNVQGGTYNGSLETSGGWYRLEVRSWKGNDLVDNQSLDRVGIGEVFLIAGQSNGQGMEDDEFSGTPSAQDDRVNCFNYNNSKENTLDLPIPSFSHLDSDSRIAPRGYRSWCWGKLGDILANRLGVPILFFNVAWTGSSIINWYESRHGGGTNSVYDGVSPYLPVGSPYANMKNVLKFYVPMTGIRSVLWLQGEADNDHGTSADRYYNNLKDVVNQSRSDAVKNVTWMISQTSWTNSKGSRSDILNAQQRVVNDMANMFLGPNTDQVQVPRIDREGVHFKGDGMNQLGEAWGNKLNEDFFSRSEPYKAVSPLRISIACAGNNQVRLSIASDGYNSFRWNDGQTSSQITVSNQSMRATAKDADGNTIVSPEIRAYDIQPATPSISIEGTNPICRGNEATLVSSIGDGVVWNTGAAGARLTVSTAGEYSVGITNVYGCQSSSDKAVISVIDSPLPAKPTITASGNLIFCDGGTVKLTSSSPVKSIWSNGSQNAAIDVKNSGDFRVKAIDDKGCYSPDSDPMTVKVNPLPAKPVISLDGPSTFCADKTITMTSNYDSGNTWSTNATTKTINTNTSGQYSLKQTDSNGCESTSNPVTIKVNPLPATPSITTLRPATFCERDYTTLSSSDAYSYVWSNGSNNKQIDVRESGDFTISAKDENGCISPPSAALKVTKNPLPPTPTITAGGPTTFCENLNVVLTSPSASGYTWSNGSTSRSVTITTAGSYTVRTINEFNCTSDPSNTISTNTLSLPPSPTIVALGATMFCDGDFVNLKASRGNKFFWNSGEEGDTIKITEPGSYAARVIDDKGCYSNYSDSIAIEVKPQPEAPEIIKTGVYTLVSKNNLNEGVHVWKRDGNILTETSNTIKANQSGSYVVNNSVTYSATLTCFSEFSQPFVLRIDPNDQFVVYPNPSTNGQITIETLATHILSDIQVIDLKGNVHKTFRVQSFDKPYFFNLSDLSNGLYLIRISTSNFNAVKKIAILK